MTVSELIEELKKLPPAAVVWVQGEGVMAERASGVRETDWEPPAVIVEIA